MLREHIDCNEIEQKTPLQNLVEFRFVCHQGLGMQNQLVTLIWQKVVFSCRTCSHCLSSMSSWVRHCVEWEWGQHNKSVVLLRHVMHACIVRAQRLYLQHGGTRHTCLEWVNWSDHSCLGCHYIPATLLTWWPWRVCFLLVRACEHTRDCSCFIIVNIRVSRRLWSSMHHVPCRASPSPISFSVSSLCWINNFISIMCT